ncbi:MAG: hypothetical protein IJI46_07045 [Erysipelotrichaceae bacterium]|nr:hypothetical protein [Erysipelotrichaceae bacterium]
MKKIILVLCLFLLCACNGKTQEEVKTPVIAGKTYYNTYDEFDNIEHSKIWFGKDGSYVMKDNFYDGYYEITGTWSVNEDVCTAEVESSGVGDFKRIIFEIKDEDTLILKTTLAGSKMDEVFSTTEVKGSGNSANNTDSGKNDTKAEIEHVFDLVDGSYNVFWNSNQKTEIVSMVELINTDMIIFQDKNDLGVSEFQGTFKEEDGYIVIVSSSKEYPFPAGMVGERFLKIKDKNTLIMEQDFPLSAAGDVFTNKSPNYDGDYVKYKHEPSDMCDDMYLPMVEFYSADRDSFVFTENLFSQMGEIFGWFEETDKGYICHVEDAHQLQGFTGADVKEIEFEKKDKDTLILKTDICMCRAGDVFKLEP